MVDLYSEIRGEALQEKAITFVKSYWRALVGILILAILMMAGGQFWASYQKGQQEKSGHAFNQAMILLSKENKPEDAMKAFAALAEDGTANFRGLAALQQAALLLKTKKIDEAVGTYKNLSDDSGVDASIRDLGAYLGAFLLYDQGKFDEAETLATPLVKTGRPWRFQSLELQAYIALAKNDAKKASDVLNILMSDNTTPPSIKDRASTLLAIASSALAAGEPKKTDLKKNDPEKSE